ncbi:PorP/SprF family type IX secretion system membrane protein [Joostella atrarenae]|uniref:PorP/SprF family type IX secretion system membrane protein n=1 Tax=Joostella atrarenae TaxID=679257 RepID=A0ABS9IZL8_9FLAO|nr:PorP/SprF family type IX secretion system membrane protein [Joostella atrarenae]MCF8713628.1 PorP/SprF family type IX secretion system membrane protein [Joostella atrarenae]
MKYRFILILLMLSSFCVSAQEDAPVASINIPAQNLLKFNRFVINPTFSTVHEDNSYLNLYHRNQWVSFDDNYQTYLGSYSGRIGDRSGLGLSVYHQRFGTIANFGVMANYAYGIRLSEISNLTFGFNVSYYNSGVDKGNINSSQPDDPTIANLQDGSLISFQPGINLSIGKFDVGFYAENAFDYNLRTSESLTDFQDKTFTGHLMYTNRFENGSGIMKDARLSALTRVRRVGEEDLNLSGSIILDLPKLGWVQTGYDDYYGLAAGLGFNITNRLSLGYTIEKGISGQVSNFGVTHEVNFAYSFQPTLSENRVFEDLEEDENLLLVDNEEVQDTITDKDAEIERLRNLVAENNMIIDEMMFKQDSMEEARKNDINKRFAYIIKYVNDNKGKGNEQEVKARAVAMMKEIDNDAYEKAEAKYNSDYNDIGTANKRSYAKANTVNNNEVSPKPKRGKTNVSATKKLVTSTTNLTDVENGAYVIANVFKSDKYLNAFLQDLESKGISAGYFEKGDLKYVYIKRYSSVADANAAYASQFNGLYDGDVWVMNIKNDNASQQKPISNTAYADAENSTEPIFNKENTNPNINTEVAILNNGLSQCTNRYVNRIFKSDHINLVEEAIAVDNDIISNPNKGYYLIANVFSDEENAKRYLKELKSEGYDANIFINPKNNYRYVYLSKYDTWQGAKNSYRTSVNYKNDIWIMPMKT